MTKAYLIITSLSPSPSTEANPAGHADVLSQRQKQTALPRRLLWTARLWLSAGWEFEGRQYISIIKKNTSVLSQGDLILFFKRQAGWQNGEYETRKKNRGQIEKMFRPGASSIVEEGLKETLNHTYCQAALRIEKSKQTNRVPSCHTAVCCFFVKMWNFK